MSTKGWDTRWQCGDACTGRQSHVSVSDRADHPMRRGSSGVLFMLRTPRSRRCLACVPSPLPLNPSNSQPMCERPREETARTRVRNASGRTSHITRSPRNGTTRKAAAAETTWHACPCVCTTSAHARTALAVRKTWPAGPRVCVPHRHVDNVESCPHRARRHTQASAAIQSCCGLTAQHNMPQAIARARANAMSARLHRV